MIPLNMKSLIGLLFLSYGICLVKPIELTFELQDKAKDCYYENIQKNTSTTLEYQVVTGGQYDVDVIIESPTREILYRQVKSQLDSHTFVAAVSGPYAICFSNEFSTFSHKIVYMHLQVGVEDPLPGIGEQVAVMTQMETTSQDIHEYLNKIINYQTHHRLKEAQSRKRAEDLNHHVALWSVTETIAILLVAIAQVYMLKRFFTEKSPTQVFYTSMY
ncbi:transmembrane emp24 domain-containing protein 3-like [Acyrthosiphon pisum]|uniref:GOLD domain-containing protein n=1 Tax=Acyrthosiphon pisum TaxID=7029 RepID=A0A8R2D735_ACYPI|nr:transmembrane emp24 domain-containing protein 3-like [Acyrthosiphon pisum]|eukprot:XP_016664033.1 PREDICTED: transmembrane emp24 domain-containing protein 3-like [Acyrthosiphon pisum]